MFRIGLIIILGYTRKIGIIINLDFIAIDTCYIAPVKVNRASYIDREPRTWERPSDHTPVIAEFDV